jgi:hypothetical protein
MGPCCNHCYVQYIEKNGDLNLEFFKSIEPGNYTIVQTPIILTETKENFFQKLLKRKEKVITPLYYSYAKIENGVSSTICNCPCHRKGEVVLH